LHDRETFASLEQDGYDGIAAFARHWRKERLPKARTTFQKGEAAAAARVDFLPHEKHGHVPGGFAKMKAALLIRPRITFCMYP
jgi:hypothetical protein